MPCFLLGGFIRVRDTIRSFPDGQYPFPDKALFLMGGLVVFVHFLDGFQFDRKPLG